MRIPIPTDVPKRIVDARSGPKFVLIAGVSATTANLSFVSNGADLLRSDAGGNPVSGLPINNASQPIKIDFFVGEIFARAGAAVELEVDERPI